jgi:hypothetical protein
MGEEFVFLIISICCNKRSNSFGQNVASATSAVPIEKRRSDKGHCIIQLPSRNTIDHHVTAEYKTGSIPRLIIRFDVFCSNLFNFSFPLWRMNNKARSHIKFNGDISLNIYTGPTHTVIFPLTNYKYSDMLRNLFFWDSVPGTTHMEYPW